MHDASSTTTTMAIVSDTHGWLDPRIAKVISQSDMAIHAGDIGNVGILAAMRPISGRVIAVLGNNDHPWLWPPEQIDTLESIPQTAEFELPGGLIAIEHGDRYRVPRPDHDSLRQAFPDSRLIVYGHTHKIIVDKEKQPWVVNPGAAGKSRNGGGPSCLLLTVTGNSWDIEKIQFLD